MKKAALALVALIALASVLLVGRDESGPRTSSPPRSGALHDRVAPTVRAAPFASAPGAPGTSARPRPEESRTPATPPPCRPGPPSIEAAIAAEVEPLART